MPQLLRGEVQTPVRSQLCCSQPWWPRLLATPLGSWGRMGGWARFLPAGSWGGGGGGTSPASTNKADTASQEILWDQ